MVAQDILQKLNKDQQEAVLAADGPVLILAGAGSGKTRVLVHRIAYLIDVLGVSPGSILAITFTNKAADEMRSRVDAIIGFGAQEVHVSTFHSLCVRILRRNAELLGFTRYFSIYDTDDQLSVMKELFRRNNIDTRTMKEKGALARISSAKDELIGPDKYLQLNRDFVSQKVGSLYEQYQRKLKESNAMDFDDLIGKTVELFEKHPEVLEQYQNRFRYMMVDEYQDTNTAQFRFVSLIAGKYRNLCVVGDDDQSIYKFRGANIRNILEFEKRFPDAHVIKLEQNYRSTKSILNAANEVIRHNHGRKSKKLWTDNAEGEKIHLRRFHTGFDEAAWITGEIAAGVHRGDRHYKDYAILYRTNAQSRLFEEKMLLANVPYRIVGGVNFYQRREVKDILAYLKTIANGMDDLQARRIINVPKRGIGAATVSKLNTYAEAGGISFFEAACAAAGGEIPGLSAQTAKKISAYTKLIEECRTFSQNGEVSGLIKKVVDETGYVAELEAEHTEEADARIDNIDELISKAVQYEETSRPATLSGFLEEVALIADIDSVEDGDDRVLLMTLHSAKGLEFPCVFMAGMEEGLFPSSMSINAENPESEIEEERRLCYVGITRAEEDLTMTCARERMIRGNIVESPLSRFVREIPRDLVDLGDEEDCQGYGRARVPLPKKGFNPGMREAITGGAAGLTFGKAFHPEREEAYSHKSPYKNPYKKTVNASDGAKQTPDFAVGDTVHHVKFGDGKVLSIEDSGKDYTVTVDFPAWGQKRLLAGFAKLKKV